MKKLFQFILTLQLLQFTTLAQSVLVSDMPTPRVGHQSCVIGGKIYVIGGANTTEGPAFKTMEVYDPVLDLWETKADMLTARANFAVCIVDGKILAIGGGESFFWDPIISIEEYDPVSNVWTYKTNLPRARMGLTACFINGKVYIIGGADGNEISFPQVDVYDPVLNSWDTTAAHIPTPRFNLSSVVLNNKIYAIGGHVPPVFEGFSTVEEYNPVTNTWTAKTDLIQGRKYLSACVMNDKIYVVGGSSGHTAGVDYLSSVEEYDPSTNTWIEKPNLPCILAGLSSAAVGQKIYISGGCFERPPTPSTLASTMYEYDPTLGPTSLATYPGYLRPTGDTLFVKALLHPDEQSASVYAKVHGNNSAYQDSVKLFDDGLHNDSLSADNLFGGFKLLSGLQEDFYGVKIFAQSPGTGITHLYPFESYFTTAGPITSDSIDFASIPNYRYTIKPFLLNSGNTLAIDNITVELSCEDSWVTQIYPALRTISSLSAGEIKYVQPYAVTYDSATFPGYFNLRFTISSNDLIYWMIDTNITVITGIGEEDHTVTDYKLFQNYPNPFNPSTKIKYTIPYASLVQIKVFDVLGNELETLVNEEKEAGIYEITWYVKNLPSGVYFYQLKAVPGAGQAGEFVRIKKMMLMK